MKRLIIITSGDPQFLLFVRHILTQEGFDTVLALDCEEALSLSRTGSAGALLLDCEASRAIALCETLKSDPQTRTVTLVALIDPAAAVEYPHYINAGVDIAFMRPMDPARFLDALRAVQLFESGRKLGDPTRSLGHADVVLDPIACQVFRNGQEVHLRLIEFNLLRCLMEQPGRVMSRHELISYAWPKGVFVDTRTVNVHMGHLRKALNVTLDYDPIRTVRGVGYALNMAGRSVGGSEKD